MSNKTELQTHFHNVRVKAGMLKHDLEQQKIRLEEAHAKSLALHQELRVLEEKFAMYTPDLPPHIPPTRPSPTLDSSLEGITIATLIKKFVERIGEPKAKALIRKYYVPGNSTSCEIVIEGGEIWTHLIPLETKGYWHTTAQKLKFYTYFYDQT